MRLERASAEQIGDSIARAAGDDLPGILEEIRQGIAEGWRVNGGEAWMVTRIEHTPHGRELVVVCFEGRNLAGITPQIIERARVAGMASVRAHTNRPGCARIYERSGAVEVERVYRVELHGRQK